jgi:hypothetical protein
VEPGANPDAVTADVLSVLQAWIAEGGGECVLHHGGRAYPLRSPVAF